PVCHFRKASTPAPSAQRNSSAVSASYPCWRPPRTTMALPVPGGAGVAAGPGVFSPSVAVMCGGVAVGVGVGVAVGSVFGVFVGRGVFVTEGSVWGMRISVSGGGGVITMTYVAPSFAGWSTVTKSGQTNVTPGGTEYTPALTALT